MKIGVSVTGMDELRATLSAFSERRLNAAVATALTRTAVEIRKAVLDEMPRVFDRPTPYTMGSLFTKGATAASLQAETYFKDDRAGSGTPATKYLLPNVEGVARHTKRFERALQAVGALPAGWLTTPASGARLDAYGNVSKGQIIQILSQLRITMTAGYTRNMAFSARKQINAQRKAGGRFFVVKPGGKSKLAPGIYIREVIGTNITPVMIFVRAAAYKPRLDFYGISQRIAAERLQPNIDRAIAESAQRMTSTAAVNGQGTP